MQVKSASESAHKRVLEVNHNSIKEEQLCASNFEVAFLQALLKERWLETHARCEMIIGCLQTEIAQSREQEEYSAAMINPGYRTKAEKQIVPANMAARDSEYPHIGEKTPALDHWFIGRVHNSIKHIQTNLGSGAKIENEPGLISRMFQVLFGETRTPGSIEKELKKQERLGAPDYSWPLLILEPPFAHGALYERLLKRAKSNELKSTGAR